MNFRFKGDNDIQTSAWKNGNVSKSLWVLGFLVISFMPISEVFAQNSKPKKVAVKDISPSLNEALIDGRINIIRAYLKKGGDPNAKIAGNTLLTMASTNGTLNCMKVLIKAGAKVNLACDDGDTPLLRSCRYLYRGGIKCVELLLASGADVNLTFPKGTSPLMSICRPPRSGYEDTYAAAMKLLLKHGAKVNAVNQLGYSPLKLAEDADAMKLITILKAAGAK